MPPDAFRSLENLWSLAGGELDVADDHAGPDGFGDYVRKALTGFGVSPVLSP